MGGRGGRVCVHGIGGGVCAVEQRVYSRPDQPRQRGRLPKMILTRIRARLAGWLDWLAARVPPDDRHDRWGFRDWQ